MLIESALNVVGGTQAGARNVISGNGLHGIHLNGGLANGNSIQGNYIGLSADGLSALAPIVLNKYGIQVSNGATNNTIGGTTPEARNTIGGHNVGVILETSSNANFVKGNYIGTDFTGLNAVPNSVGVYVFHASNNIIGGSSAGAGNVISGNNNVGVVINGGGAGAVTTENSITGNLIGLKVGGLSALGNRNGVEVYDASLTYIAGNIVSGNFIGIAIRSNNTQVHGNYIGTDLNGTTAVPNTLDGVYLDTGTANYIGGLTAEEGNVISGNGRHGIFLTDLTVGSTTGNQILKNRIGTDASGLAALGNTLDGVHISKSSDNFVGESPDLGNVIAFNGRNGVTIASTGTVINGILNNAIHSNGALGIDLAPLDGGGNPILGVTANDSGDGDSGPNGLTNFPVLANATAYPFGTGMRLAVQGSLDVPVNSKVQFFRSTACDSSGNGEGQTFLGEISLAYNGSVMNFNQTLTLPAGVILNAGDTITATAISNLGTSEFSACLPVQIPTLTINDISVNEGNSGTTNATFTVTLSDVQGAPGPITVNYATANGTALAGSDYTAANGTLTFDGPFAQNTITQTITVSVLGDTTVESSETFFVNLTSSNGATLADNQGQATIVNDDVSCPAITLAPPTLPNGQMGQSYTQQLTASGGAAPYSFSLSAGELPNNLNLSSSGLLSGAPTASGTFNFTVRATDNNGCTGERSYTLLVQMSCPTIILNPATLSDGSVGVLYTQTIAASGGSGPYGYAVTAGSLPNGISLTTGGAINGTPTTPGIFNFTVTATDSNGCTGSRAYAVTIESTSGLQFYPLARPVRLLDTRAGQGNCDSVNAPITGGNSLTTLARTTCESISIPSTASAVVGNLTVINQSSQAGYLTIYPDGVSAPLAANMIYQPGQILANNFTVGLSNDGKFNVFGERTIDVIVDISGYFAPPNSGGLYYHPLNKPIRLLDTRAGQGNCDSVNAPIAGGTSLTTLARTTCDGLTIPAAAQAIVGNATVINGSGQTGYLTIYPDGVAAPLAANIVYFPGSILSNAFTVALSNDGKFNIFAERTIDMVVDVAGYYSNEASDSNGPGLLLTPLARPLRIMDTRASQGNCDNVAAPITGGSTLEAPAWLTCESLTIPNTARAVLGNVTVINLSGQLGFLTMFPDQVTQPLSANMVYFPGQVLSNAFVVGLNASSGQYVIFAERTLEAIVDVSAYFAP